MERNNNFSSRKNIRPIIKDPSEKKFVDSDEEAFKEDKKKKNPSISGNVFVFLNFSLF